MNGLAHRCKCDNQLQGILNLIVTAEMCYAEKEIEN